MTTQRLEEFIERQRKRAEAAEVFFRLDNQFPGLLDEYLAVRAEVDAGGDTPASLAPETPVAENGEVDPELSGKTADEAAAVILRRVGRPMRSPEIVEHLRAGGFGKDYSDLRNSVHVGMGRKTKVFERDENGAWSLKRKRKLVIEKQDDGGSLQTTASD